MNTPQANTQKQTHKLSVLAGFMPRALAVLALAAACGAASADVVTVLGNTAAAPIWTRTTAGTPPTGLSGTGTAVPYVVTPFSVSTTGTYSLLNVANYDAYLHLYVTAFNPLDQFTNVLAANDDSGGTLDSLITTSLTAGLQYLAVSSGFDNTDFGNFTLTISGPGTIRLGTSNATVPEPTSFALAGLALLGLAASTRRRAA